MREIIPYNPILREQARKNRNNPTKAEKLLWQKLKGKQLKDLDFDRQRPINNFIVDFFCHENKLAIEIDGDSHIGQEISDNERQKILESFGIRFLRFSNNDIYENLESVLDNIIMYIEKNNNT